MKKENETADEMFNRMWKAIQDYKKMEFDDSSQEEVNNAYHKLELLQEEFNLYEKEARVLEIMNGDCSDKCECGNSSIVDKLVKEIKGG